MSRVFDFGGFNQSHLQSASSPVYNSLNAVTLAAWVNVDALPPSGNTGSLFIKSPQSSSGNYFVGLANSGSGILFMEAFAQSGHVALSEATNFPVGVWTHVVATFDFNSNQKVRLFVDGVEVTYSLQITQMTGAGEVPPNDSADGWWIGLDTPGTVWPGAVAEAAIWSRALAPSEISQLYSSTIGVPQSISNGLVGYWHLLGLVSPEPDASGNGNSMNVFINAIPGPDSPGYGGKPEISVNVTQQPLGQNVAAGQTATFTTVAVGGGIPAYQWQTTNHRIALASGFVPLPGAEVDGFWNIVGATAASYTTPTLQASDNGTKFLCLIKGSNPIPQSVANSSTSQQLSSVIVTQPATLLVH